MTRFACKLADLVFILSARYPTAERYCREYIVPSAKGIAISYSDEDMRREREKTGMPPPLCELSLLYREICRKLLFHDGMVFHASVVAVANRAYSAFRYRQIDTCGAVEAEIRFRRRDGQ